MKPRLFLDVDPRTLHLPTTRLSGADPVKLHRQMARFGMSFQGMPTLEVTRATRIAKLCPGQLVRVEVIDDIATPVGHLPTIGDKLP